MTMRELASIAVGKVNQHLELFCVFVLVAYAYWSISRANKKQAYAKKLVAKAKAANANEPTTLHPDIDPSKCTGCGACTRVCPEGDILQMINHRAVLVGPSKCVGHGECERACPMEAITLVFGTKTRGIEIPRVTSDYETNIPGLYIAGELGGMGLIRNAIKQGVAAAEHAFKNLKSKSATEFDLFIVGGGPAGLAAGLVSVAQGKKHLIIDQNSFGGTVYNFPRQKIVMTHPADLPLVGKMKFKSNKVSKEELLQYWQDVREKTGLKVQEKTKFESLEAKGNHFVVKTDKGQHTAAKVILAMGVRGSPRRLGLPNEELPKVTYNLLDSEQYVGKNVCVVGGGNAGVEAAQMLGKAELKNKVRLLVRGEGFDRCNEDNKNRVNAMASKGLVDIWYKSSVKKIEPDHIVVARDDKDFKVDNDFLFVFAGAEMPQKFLMSLGIEIDKKFGEGLKKSV